MSVSATRQLFQRLMTLIRSQPREDDLAREIAAHLQLLEDKFRAEGMTAGEAHHAAMRTFGNIAHHKDLTRDTWTFPSLDSIRQDIWYAVRTIRRSPGFSVMAIAVLALGIAGNTAMFSSILWSRCERSNV